MFRLIFWAIIIYLVIKIAKSVIRILSGPAEPKDQVHGNNSSDEQRKPYSIDQKDIVDAEFKEIKEDKEKKTGE